MFKAMFTNHTRYIRVFVAGHNPQLFASVASIIGWARRIGITDTNTLRMEPAGFVIER